MVPQIWGITFKLFEQYFLKLGPKTTFSYLGEKRPLRKPPGAGERAPPKDSPGEKYLRGSGLGKKNTGGFKKGRNLLTSLPLSLPSLFFFWRRDEKES